MRKKKRKKWSHKKDVNERTLQNGDTAFCLFPPLRDNVNLENRFKIPFDLLHHKNVVFILFGKIK